MTQKVNYKAPLFSDESVVLLTLYEFEAKAQLGDPDLSACLHAAESLPHTEPSTFETLAGKQLQIINLYFSIEAIEDCGSFSNG